jgi:response regulator RpfG family c-di-GMP phosphodiesterase/class 3 adenylate cyclase
MAEPNPDLTGLTDSEVPGLLTGTWPLKLRSFLARRLELLFVILILGMVLTVFFLIPYKIAFLNLFYLPVLTAAYFIGKRKAVLGSVLCILLVFFLAFQFPDWFALPATRFNTLMRVATWGSFLILTSAAVGSLQERLARGFEETRQLYEELKRSRVMEEMKEKVERTLYSTMDPIVAKLATEGKLRFEKRDISIMFTDLTNFTRYSDQNRPDVVVDELNSYLSQMEPITELFRGHIDKYMGDGMMIEFGAPVDYDRHALLAVLAGWKMQQKMSQLSLPWRMRVGIASGSAIVGMMGAKRQSYTALGDRVNLAKRLEEICPPGKVCIDEPTYLAVKPFFLASKLRSAAYGRQGDPELLERLEALEEKLAQEGESAPLLFDLGQTSSKLNDASAALRYLKRAMALDPNSTEIKLAFADANIQKDEVEKIKIKGKLEKVTVYEVTMLKDRWNDLMVIPEGVAVKYQGVEQMLEVPESIVLGAEALDGSVGNSRVVALLSYALADHLNLNEDLKRSILLAGYLQDIGKEAVPHHILNRTGSLTEQETKLVEKYVQESVASMKRLGYVDPKVVEIVAHHHEAWNGAGYPDHLAGEAIPVGARITSVAEAYSALTSWRPYREPWDARVALSELRKGVEKGRYDPKIVDSLEELLKSQS